MSKFSWLRTLDMAFFLCLTCSLGLAQATRTWVSGVGDDVNPCSRTAPCKTFAGAISKTAAAGEINVLDPGSFGALTITKAITIDGGGGQVTSVLSAGTNGVVVAANPTDTVILRNLRINGVKGTVSPGVNGIRFISGGALIVDKCEIFGFSNNGIDIALAGSASVWVTATNIEDVGSIGISATTTAGVVTVGVDKVRILLSNKGIEAANHSRVTVNDSFVQQAASIGMQADGDAFISINASEIDLNGSGVQTGPGAGNVSVSNSQVAYNSTAFNVFV